MADTNLVENLFAAVDTLIEARMNKLQFDKTLVCTIESVADASKGEYKVTDGATHFTAYSDVEYVEGARVYVTVPNGDMNAHKIITGRYVSDDDEYYTYISPLNNFIDVTGNILSSSEQFGLTANNEKEKYVDLLFNLEGLHYKGYEKLGLSAEFTSWLSNFNVSTGNYGIILYVTTKETDTSERSYTLYLDSQNMYGNPYNFGVGYKQETVFNIGNMTEIVSIKGYFYHRDNFITATGERVPSTDDEGNTLPHNLFVENIYLSLGYDLANYTEDKVILGTNDSLKYNKDKAPHDRTVYMRWVHKDDSGDLRVIDQDQELPEGSKIHWYQFKIEADRYDDLAGDFWKEIAVTDTFNYNFQPDIHANDDRIKVIIESPSLEYAIEQSHNGNNGISAALASLHDSGLSQNDYDLVLEAVFGSGDDIGMIDAPTVDQVNAISDELSEKTSAVLSENSAYTELLNAILEVRAQVQYYESDILMFTNEVPQDLEAIDWVRGLEIECDVDGMNGVYRCYDETSNIQNVSEARKLRKLTAKYQSVVTGIKELDGAEKITWYIPGENTMIEMPQQGKEYDTKDGEKDPTTNMPLGDEFIPLGECDRTGYVAIIRHGLEIMPLEDSESNEAIKGIEIEQMFRIKEYYMATASNNTIYCVVTKNGRDYEASVSLIFGSLGTNGTDATFILDMVDGNEYQTNSLYVSNEQGKCDINVVTPHLYNFNNEEVELDDYSITYKWYSHGTIQKDAAGNSLSNGLMFRRQGTNDNHYTTSGITIPGSAKVEIAANIGSSFEAFKNAARFCILQAEVKYGQCFSASAEEGEEDPEADEDKVREITLTAYLPIAVCYNKDISHSEGPTRIMYNSIGNDPKYYKDPFKLFKKNDLNPIPNVSWYAMIKELEEAEDEQTEVMIKRYYPTVDLESGTIKVPDMYFDGLQSYAVDGYTDTLVWSQPIIIAQNAYGSSMLNSWDGSLKIDEENGTIMSTMMGAGIKNADNSFSGVLMGDVAGTVEGTTSSLTTDNGSTRTRRTGMGIYGYQKGAQSFGFNIDGTAFIGKSGKGQINFDGRNGTIKSGNYQEPKVLDGEMVKHENATGHGMLIDLDNSILNAYGSGGSFQMNMYSDPEKPDAAADKPLLRIKDADGHDLFYVSGLSKDPITSEEYRDFDNDEIISSSEGYQPLYKDLEEKYINEMKAIIRNDELKGDAKTQALNKLREEYKAQRALLKDNEDYLSDEELEAVATDVVAIEDAAEDTTTLQDTANDYTAYEQEEMAGEIVDYKPSKYFLQSSNYEANKEGMKIDLQNGTIFMAGNGGKIMLDSSHSNKLFQVQSAEGNTIINVSGDKNGYYLKSNNFSSAQRSGLKFDLSRGKLEAYDFTLKALNPTVNSYITLSSQGSPYFRVNNTSDVQYESCMFCTVFEPRTYYVLSAAAQRAMKTIDTAAPDEIVLVDSAKDTNDMPYITTFAFKDKSENEVKIDDLREEMILYRKLGSDESFFKEVDISAADLEQDRLRDAGKQLYYIAVDGKFMHPAIPKKRQSDGTYLEVPFEEALSEELQKDYLYDYEYSAADTFFVKAQYTGVDVIPQASVFDPAHKTYYMPSGVTYQTGEGAKNTNVAVLATGAFDPTLQYYRVSGGSPTPVTLKDGNLLYAPNKFYKIIENTREEIETPSHLYDPNDVYYFKDKDQSGNYVKETKTVKDPNLIYYESGKYQIGGGIKLQPSTGYQRGVVYYKTPKDNVVYDMSDPNPFNWKVNNVEVYHVRAPGSKIYEPNKYYSGDINKIKDDKKFDRNKIYYEPDPNNPKQLIPVKEMLNPDIYGGYEEYDVNHPEKYWCLQPTYFEVSIDKGDGKSGYNSYATYYTMTGQVIELQPPLGADEVLWEDGKYVTLEVVTKMTTELATEATMQPNTVYGMSVNGVIEPADVYSSLDGASIYQPNTYYYLTNIFPNGYQQVPSTASFDPTQKYFTRSSETYFANGEATWCYTEILGFKDTSSCFTKLSGFFGNYIRPSTNLQDSKLLDCYVLQNDVYVPYLSCFSGTKLTSDIDIFQIMPGTGQNVNLINISKTQYELKSHDWNGRTKGIHFNIAANAGYIEGYGKYIAAATGETKYPKFIIDWRKNGNPINVNNGAFMVKWNGEVRSTNIVATGGRIGNWYIDKNGIYSYNPNTGSSKEGVALLGQGTENEGGLRIAVGSFTVVTTGSTTVDGDDGSKITFDDVQAKDTGFSVYSNGLMRSYKGEFWSSTIQSATITNGSINNASINYCKISHGSINSASIGSVSINNATISNGSWTNCNITSGTISTCNINSCDIDSCNVTSCTITKGTIGSFSIGEGLSGEGVHITSGQINANGIVVSNLNVNDSLYVGGASYSGKSVIAHNSASFKTLTVVTDVPYETKSIYYTSDLESATYYTGGSAELDPKTKHEFTSTAIGQKVIYYTGARIKSGSTTANTVTKVKSGASSHSVMILSSTPSTDTITGFNGIPGSISALGTEGYHP